MCELFAVSYTRERVINPMLGEFFSHGCNHPHGWGMAFLGNGTHMAKEPVNSCDSLYLRKCLNTTVAADVMLAHIRLATRGVIDYNNTHPFVMSDCSGRTWTQAHNGTIGSGNILSGYTSEQQGDTDSERLLIHITASINAATIRRARPLNAAERFSVVDNVIHEITPGNKVNLLLHDGEMLYVHSNCKGSLYQCRSGDGVVFSTRPLNSGDSWDPVPLSRLMAYRRGRIAAAGEQHNNEFVQDEDEARREIMKYLAMYSRPRMAASC